MVRTVDRPNTPIWPARPQNSRRPPLYSSRMRPRSSLSASESWRHVIVGQSLLTDTPFASMIKDGVDPTAVEGAADTHYDIPNFHVYANHPKVNVPVLWWRSVGHTHTAFVMETLIDELATRAKMDPTLAV